MFQVKYYFYRKIIFFSVFFPCREAVEKLKEQIAQGLSSSLTHDNKSLITAEESLAELKYAVENIKTVISQSERDSKVVSK